MSRKQIITCDKCGKIIEDEGVDIRTYTPDCFYSIDFCPDCAKLMYAFIRKETDKCSH